MELERLEFDDFVLGNFFLIERRIVNTGEFHAIAIDKETIRLRVPNPLRKRLVANIPVITIVVAGADNQIGPLALYCPISSIEVILQSPRLVGTTRRRSTDFPRICRDPSLRLQETGCSTT